MELRLAASDIEAIARQVVLKMAEMNDRPKCGAKPHVADTTPKESDDALAVTYQGAAKLLSVSDRTVFSMCQEGQLKVVSIGRAKRVLRSSVEEFLASQQKTA